MTARQREKIAQSAAAFAKNFGPVRIESADYGGGFYVHYPAESDSYMVFCPTIDYLDGWLYGCVQGVRRVEPEREKNNIKTEIE